jgi:hypothetical protein
MQVLNCGIFLLGTLVIRQKGVTKGSLFSCLDAIWKRAVLAIFDVHRVLRKPV